jgi:hypothetical protein
VIDTPRVEATVARGAAEVVSQERPEPRPSFTTIRAGPDYSFGDTPEDAAVASVARAQLPLTASGTLLEGVA